MTQNIECLNHITCRKLFRKKDYKEICDNPDYELKVDRSCTETYSKEYLFKCGMDNIIIELEFIYAAFPKEELKLDYNELKVKKFTVDKIDISSINFSKLKI